MRKCLFIAFALFYCIESGYAQLKLKDIPYGLNEINKRDYKGKQGTWYFYDKVDSIVYALQHFKDDTLNGYFERYWHNGKISEWGFYKNGKLDSIFISYWENGQKRGEANYVNGILNGIVISFDEERKITTQLRYINGKVDSSYAESYVDSTIVWDNQPIKIDTVKTTYASDWNKKYAVYVNDTLCKEIIYYKDVITIENYLDKAVLTKRIVYSRTKPHNIEKIFYYVNGDLSKTERYNRKGKLIGSRK